MKRILFLSGVIVLLISCSGNSSSSDPFEAKKQADAQNAAAHPELAKGKELIANNQCLTCHKEDEKLIGPAYKDVAKKYAGMPDTIITYLASKIIAGGKGTWGDVLMTPHPTLSKDDAETIVKYILSLR